MKTYKVNLKAGDHSFVSKDDIEQYAPASSWFLPECVRVRLARRADGGSDGYEVSLTSKLAAVGLAAGLMVAMPTDAQAAEMTLPSVSDTSIATFMPSALEEVSHATEVVTPSCDFASMNALSDRNGDAVLFAAYHNNTNFTPHTNNTDNHTNAPWTNHANTPGGHSDSAWNNHANFAPIGGVHTNMVHGDFVF